MLHTEYQYAAAECRHAPTGATPYTQNHNTLYATSSYRAQYADTHHMVNCAGSTGCKKKEGSAPGTAFINVHFLLYSFPVIIVAFCATQLFGTRRYAFAFFPFPALPALPSLPAAAAASAASFALRSSSSRAKFSRAVASMSLILFSWFTRVADGS